MRRLKERLKEQEGDGVRRRWESIDGEPELSTREKLEKLVSLSLRRQGRPEAARPAAAPRPAAGEPFETRDFSYSLDAPFGPVRLGQWRQVPPASLARLANDDGLAAVDPQKLLFIDTETTGLAGGTGTVPFIVGLGCFDGDCFRVREYVLRDLGAEGGMLAAVDSFLAERGVSAAVSFNGKAFDYPLLEARYVLQRRRFPLLKVPHLDFLFPARSLWKHTYESRRLGYLGEMLLGLSRQDDIEGADIPALYFSFLRSGAFSLLEPVIEHNALDLVGLAALLLLACRYLEDPARTRDEGELLGLGLIHERRGELGKAEELYRLARAGGVRRDVSAPAARRLSALLKRRRLFDEARILWQELSLLDDAASVRELSIHYEHRLGDYGGALTVVEEALTRVSLTPARRLDLEKRLQRLQKKLAELPDVTEAE